MPCPVGTDAELVVQVMFIYGRRHGSAGMFSDGACRVQYCPNGNIGLSLRARERDETLRSALGGTLEKVWDAYGCGFDGSIGPERARLWR